MEVLNRLLGGDAPRSAAKAAKRSGRRRENLRRVLTAHLPPDHAPTRDAADAAHDDRDRDGLLVPAVVAHGARPRLYPEHQMTSRGVAYDSAYDELYERQRWLDWEVGAVPGVSYACGGAANGGSASAEVVRRSGAASAGALARRNRRAW